jgi:hypothetical protein
VDPLEAAIASGDAVNGLGTHFMMDMATYAYGAELGYEGVDFYIAGRGGALGDVPADVVTAAFVFFSPTAVRDAWERTASLLPRLEVAAEFAGVAHRWAEDHIADDVDVDLDRLAVLAGRLVAGASVAGAPLFAGWRALPEPPATRAKALVLHRINALRELRGARHGAAVLSQGIDPHAAVARRTPYMLGVFGWEPPHPDKADVRDAWDAAQAATERALAPVFAVLEEAERAEFAAAATALQAAVNPG